MHITMSITLHHITNEIDNVLHETKQLLLYIYIYIYIYIYTYIYISCTMYNAENTSKNDITIPS